MGLALAGRDGEAPRRLRRAWTRCPGDAPRCRRRSTGRSPASPASASPTPQPSASPRSCNFFYPAQFVGLVKSQPMGFYPVEVLVNDAKRHGWPSCRWTSTPPPHRTARLGARRPRRRRRLPRPRPGGAAAAGCRDRRPSPAGPLTSLREPVPRRARALDREKARALGVPRLGLHLVKGIGGEHAAHLDGAGPWAVRVPGRRGGPDGAPGRGHRAADPGRSAEFARSAAARAPLAAGETARPAKGAPRGGGRVGGAGRWTGDARARAPAALGAGAAGQRLQLLWLDASVMTTSPALSLGELGAGDRHHPAGAGRRGRWPSAAS